MKKTIHINLPGDFCQLCDIFGFRPDEVIQEFVRRISLPRYFRDPEDSHRWANLFFLDYLDNLTPRPLRHNDIHDKYSDLLTEKADEAANSRQRDQACRKVLAEWRQAIREAEALS